MKACDWLWSSSHGSITWQGHLGGPGGSHVGPSGVANWPSASCHVHLLHVSIFVTILAYFCHISCIQIILQAQVELGKIKTKFYTCDDDLPHVTMILGEMLMVKMGVSDHQQAPPSYPFAVLSKDAGLA